MIRCSVTEDFGVAIVFRVSCEVAEVIKSAAEDFGSMKVIDREDSTIIESETEVSREMMGLLRLKLSMLSRFNDSLTLNS